MYSSSPIRGFYIALASWANQPAMYKSFTFREYCIKKGISAKVYSKYKDNPDQYLLDGYKKGATWRYLDELEAKYPDIAKKLFDTAKLTTLDKSQKLEMAKQLRFRYNASVSQIRRILHIEERILQNMFPENVRK